MVNTNIKIIIDIFFLTLSNINILFVEQELSWKLHTLAKTLLIIKQLQIINQKKIVITTLKFGKKVFVIYVFSINLGLKILIYCA